MRQLLVLVALGGMCSAVHPKRGFVANSDNAPATCDDPLLLSNSGWFYDYNVADPYRVAGLSGDCAKVNATDGPRFAPMHWCVSSLKDKVPDFVNTTFMLGFNEPNNKHNCNLPARDVAQAWGEVMKRWPNSQLVSPATAGNGIVWYQEFFGNCSELYGHTGCNISYLATHDYSCDPDHTLEYLKELYDLFHLKIWLTEFSCGDGADHKPEEDQYNYMKAVLPMLDQADFVYRYAWMCARGDIRGLLETVGGKAQLTKLGQLYNS